MKKYIPFFLLILLAGVRIHFTCFNVEGQNSCEIIERKREKDTKINHILNSIRYKSIDICRKNLPSPHSELVLGMVLGVDDFDKLPRFEAALKKTGTIHVVVVSGFNISLVYGSIVKMLGSPYKKRNVIIAQVCTLFYSLLSGFGAPVVRSWLMGSIAAWGKYYGRPNDATLLLIFSAVLMLIINPPYLFSLSFQLSFLATLGLVVFGNLSFFKRIQKKLSSFFIDDLISSVSATLFVWPLISNTFGTVSLFGIVVNALILWTVSLSTILGFALLFTGLISNFLGYVVSLVLYPFLDIFVRVIWFFEKINFMSMDFEISNKALIFYYISIFSVIYIPILYKYMYLRQKKISNNNERSRVY